MAGTTTRSASKFARTIDSPAKRSKLPPRRDPYWVSCGTKRGGISLGYRRLGTEGAAGTWVMRLIHEGHRHEEKLGPADDAASSGGMTFAQATTSAIEAANRRREMLCLAKPVGDPATVQTAVSAYLVTRKQRNSRNGRDAETRLQKHLLDAKQGMGERTLGSLTEAHWRQWRRNLDGLSAASVERITNDVRAAMNRAWTEHHRELPPRWRDMLEQGLKEANRPISAPRSANNSAREWLEVADVQRLVVAAYEVDEDFGRLVLVLASTGARLSQVARLRVGDIVTGCNPKIMMPPSRKGGHGSTKAPFIAIQVGSDVVAALVPVITGRNAAETLLEHWLHAQVPGDKDTGTAPSWQPVRREPWTSAASMNRQWHAALKAAGMASTIPYRLRDSSIIRMLKAGLPLALVASLHDTSAPIISTHYAAHVHDALSQLARDAVVTLRPNPT